MAACTGDIVFESEATRRVCGLVGVILPRGNEREVDEELGEELRRAVEVHYVTRVDGLCWT